MSNSNLRYEFVDSDADESHILDDSIDSSTTGPLTEIQFDNTHMITVTLRPEYHDLACDTQYELLREKIQLATTPHEALLFCAFELTKKGNVHAHMIVSGYLPQIKEIKYRLRTECGHVLAKPIFSFWGAYNYCNKQNSHPPMVSPALNSIKRAGVS